MPRFCEKVTCHSTDCNNCKFIIRFMTVLDCLINMTNDVTVKRTSKSTVRSHHYITGFLNWTAGQHWMIGILCCQLQLMLSLPGFFPCKEQMLLHS